MENFWLYIILCVLLIILPGPDTAVVTKNTLLISKKAGFQTMFGTLSALMIHTTFAVVGLSALIVKSAQLFMLLKLIGAIYLVYLGIKTYILLIKNKTPEQSAKSHQKQSSYIQGFLTNLLNPKVAVFFLTFLPQFVSNADQAIISFLLLGLTYSLLTFIWFIFYITLLNQIKSFMTKPVTRKWMEGITGGVLIAFGIQLAFTK